MTVVLFRDESAEFQRRESRVCLLVRSSGHGLAMDWWISQGLGLDWSMIVGGFAWDWVD